MKAAVLYGKETIRVEDVAERALAPGEVRIGIEAALTCGTDLKVYKRGYHALMIKPPAVFGHELAGTITETKSAGWPVGTRVVVANSAPCGSCFFCEQAQEYLCEDLQFLNGAYAQSIVVPRRFVEKNLWRLQPGTRCRDAALTEPLACVVQGIDDCNLRDGQRVLVIGSGPIGLMFVALARHAGCETTVAGRGMRRLETARRLGAANLVDMTGREDTLAGVQAAGLRPFDVVVEATGRPEVWEAAPHLVRKGGLINWFGGCPAGTSIRLETALIHYSSLRLISSFHHTPRTIHKALEFIEQGVIQAEEFVDGECALSDLPPLFRSMASGNHAVKSLIRVNE